MGHHAVIPAKPVLARRSGGNAPTPAKRIVVQSDSQLLVRQLNGEYRVKDEKLRVPFQRAPTLLRQFDAYRIVHMRREMNPLADRLAIKVSAARFAIPSRAKAD
jgi:ribonuclease HI